MIPGHYRLFSSEVHGAVAASLDQAIGIDGAAKGNVQWFDQSTDCLEIVAQHGFNREFLQLFQCVRTDEPSACARAVRQGCRVSVPDVTTDRPFAPYLSVARANGFRSVQSTPVFGPRRRLLGVLSTHFARPHRLSAAAGAALDEVASDLGRLLVA
jgi:GAF domain-containing protein